MEDITTTALEYENTESTEALDLENDASEELDLADEQQIVRELSRRADKDDEPVSFFRRILALLGVVLVLAFFALIIISMLTQNKVAQQLMLFFMLPTIGIFFYLRARNRTK